jgi:hypothetical protein
MGMGMGSDFKPALDHQTKVIPAKHQGISEIIQTRAYWIIALISYIFRRNQETGKTVSVVCSVRNQIWPNASA